jgi:hypothetical protein
MPDVPIGAATTPAEYRACSSTMAAARGSRRAHAAKDYGLPCGAGVGNEVEVAGSDTGMRIGAALVAHALTHGSA